MNKDAMRKQMEDVRDELNRLDGQRVALEQILRGYEAWFRSLPENGTRSQHQLKLPVGGRGGATKGSIGIQNAFKEVLKQARGEPLPNAEIWLRMQEKGAKSDAKRPLGIIDLIGKRVPEAEKVAVRTWRWRVPAITTNHTNGESH
jgi:hypothetical protein